MLFWNINRIVLIDYLEKRENHYRNKLRVNCLGQKKNSHRKTSLLYQNNKASHSSKVDIQKSKLNPLDIESSAT